MLQQKLNDLEGLISQLLGVETFDQGESLLLRVAQHGSRNSSSGSDRGHM